MSGQTAFGSTFPPAANTAPEYIDIEVHDGTRWLSLNDGSSFELGARTLEQTQQALRNHTVSSSQFDGEFVVHTTRGNVTETVEVYAVAGDQVRVTNDLERIKAAFSQHMYFVRRTFGADVEVWRCFPAEWALQRGHVMIHNRRAHITFSVPRLPGVTREVRE